LQAAEAVFVRVAGLGRAGGRGFLVKIATNAFQARGIGETAELNAEILAACLSLWW